MSIVIPIQYSPHLRLKLHSLRRIISCKRMAELKEGKSYENYDVMNKIKSYDINKQTNTY